MVKGTLECKEMYPWKRTSQAFPVSDFKKTVDPNVCLSNSKCSLKIPVERDDPMVIQTLSIPDEFKVLNGIRDKIIEIVEEEKDDELLKFWIQEFWIQVDEQELGVYRGDQ